MVAETRAGRIIHNDNRLVAPGGDLEVWAASGQGSREACQESECSDDGVCSHDAKLEGGLLRCCSSGGRIIKTNTAKKLTLA